jgi:hypothetical protein
LGENQTIRVNYRHGVKVIDTVIGQYNRKLDPFDRPAAKLPQDPAHMPETLGAGTVQHAQFLFATCYYMRGGVDSETAFKQLSRIYDETPQYFDPFHVAQFVSVDELRAVLQAVGLNYRKSQTPEFWLDNARRLVELWDGNPVNIFADVTSYAEACHHIQNDMKGGGFRGFQKKMVSMLIYYLMDAGFVSAFDFPIPVDFHVARLTLQNRIITVPGALPTANLVYDERVLDRIREFYLRYSTERSVDPLHLCNAVWMYSRLKCSNNPENLTRTTEREQNRRATVAKVTPDWSQPATMRQWLSACGTCKLTDQCRFNVAAGYYYTHGQIRLDDPRQGPPPESSLLTPAMNSSTYVWQLPPTATLPKESVEPNPNQLKLSPS